MTPDRVFHLQSGSFPSQPGIYLVKDSEGKLLLVGMAVNLRRRLNELFGEDSEAKNQPASRHAFQKMPLLLNRICVIEVMIVDDEAQRVHLTNHLITTYRPYFNLATFLEVTGYAYIYQTNEVFPRFVVAEHRSAETAAAVYGPFPTGPTRTRLLKCLNDALGLRTCSPLPKRACSLYAAGRCTAPCEGHISEQGYNHLVTRAIAYLQAPLLFIEFLEEQMDSAAKEMQFEKAGALRDDIQALRKAFKRVREAPVADGDQDVIYIDQGMGVCLRLKRGWLEGFACFDAPFSILEALTTYYQGHEKPQQIIVPDAWESYALSSRLNCPVNGPANRLEQWALTAAQANHDIWVANKMRCFEL